MHEPSRFAAAGRRVVAARTRAFSSCLALLGLASGVVGCDQMLGADFDVSSRATLSPPAAKKDSTVSVAGGGAPEAASAPSAHCDELGALSCQGAAQKVRLVCDGSSWQIDRACGDDENCDSASGRCARIVPDCRGQKPGHRFCSEDGKDELYACGPDLVSEQLLASCEGRCVGEIAGLADAGEAGCAAPRCGDGKLSGLEACDDANRDDGDACPRSCEPAQCGDGFLWRDHERCDDGNTVAADGCSARCELEAKQLSLFNHVCVLLRGGRPECWGWNSRGELGVGDVETRGDDPNELGAHLPPIDLGSEQKVASVQVGISRTCVILESGRVKCWGKNQYGVLGLGDTAERGDDPARMGDNLPYLELGTGLTARALALGEDDSCALLNDGSVKCWGRDESTGADWLNDIIPDTVRGDDPGEMGDNLPRIALGTGRTAIALAGGFWHTCALLDDGSVKCWGFDDEEDVLGQKDWVDRSRDDASLMGDNLPPIALGRPAIAIGAGSDHSCALLDDGSVKCWGLGYYGVLGCGRGAVSTEVPYCTIDFGARHHVIALAVGLTHNCAILEDHSLRCWGQNKYGQLGLGDTEDRGDEPGEMGDDLPPVDLGVGVTVESVAAGNSFTCAVLSDESVKCWGKQSGGRLGPGIEDLGDNIGEMGDDLARLPL